MRPFAEPPLTEPAFSLRRIAVPAFGPSLLFGIGEGAILPVVALSVRQLDGSQALAALIVTLLGIGSLLCNIPASLITARYGERWALVGAAIWGALAMAVCLAAAAPWALALGVFMIGMSAAVFFLARQSYLTEAVPLHFRARALSTLGGVMRIGLFIGPFLGAAVIGFFGLGGAYAVGVAALLAAAVLSWFIPDLPGEAGGGAGAFGAAPAAGQASGAGAAPLAGAGAPAAAPATRNAIETPSLLSVTRNHAGILRTVGVGVLLVSAVRASRQAVVPLWAEHIGLDAATTSLIYGLAGAVDMLVFYPAGKVMDRKGRNWVAVPSMLLMGLALLLMPLTEAALGLLLVALLIGFGNGIGSGMIMTLGADYSPSPGRAHFLGVWRLMSDIGSTAGPAVLSAATAVLSLAAGVVCTGGIALAAAGVLWYWIPRTGKPATVPA